MSSVDLNVIIFMVLHKKARDGAGMVGVNGPVGSSYKMYDLARLKLTGTVKPAGVRGRACASAQEERVAGWLSQGWSGWMLCKWQLSEEVAV